MLSHVLCCSSVLLQQRECGINGRTPQAALRASAAIMSDRETRLMARMRRQDEARRERRDRITTYGLGVVIITFVGARYTNHGKLERACLALLAAFGAYAVRGVALARGRDRVDGVDGRLLTHRSVMSAARARFRRRGPRPQPFSCGEYWAVVPTRKTIRTNNLNTHSLERPYARPQQLDLGVRRRPHQNGEPPRCRGVVDRRRKTPRVTFNHPPETHGVVSTPLRIRVPQKVPEEPRIHVHL